MTKRENILSILHRTGGDHIPFELSFTPRLQAEFRERSGSESVADYYDFDFREVGIGPSRFSHDYSEYYADRTLHADVLFDSDGVAREPGDFEHFTHMVSPLAGPGTAAADAEVYPLDDRDAEYRFANTKTTVEAFHRNGYAVRATVGHTFETAWQIRGMEDFLMDFHTSPAIPDILLERLTERNCGMIRQFASMGVDIIRLGDDVGTQHGMMMSPDVWRSFLKPRLARIIRTAKDINTDVLIFYHSDGNIDAIIPDLIEIGLDILNPVQPECLDPVVCKKKYGDKLSFWGTMGTQSVMPFGTPDEVRKTVRHMIDEVGYDGGLVLAPTHVLEPEVPWANIDAYVTACREFGRR